MNTGEISDSSSNLLPLIETIYSAVDDESLWPFVLEQIAELTQGYETLMWTAFPGSQAANILCAARMDLAVLVPYAEYYGQVNILAQRCDKLYEDGEVRYSTRAMPDAEFETTEFYNDYFNPNGMFYSWGVRLPLDDQPRPYLASMRPKHQRPFDQTEGALVEKVIPHLQRALGLHLKFTQLRSNANGLEAALDALDHAVFGLDREGKVVLSNRHAERLVQAGDGIKLSNRFLVAADLGDNSRLQSQLAGAVATSIGGGTSAGGSLLLNRKPGKPPLSLTVTPFTSPSLARNYGRLTALVFIADRAQKPLSRSDALRNLYQLAPTEGRIADALVDGLDVAAISEMAGFTQDTVRFYLKSIFRKTGVNRQSELMKLILRLPGV